MSRFNGRCSPAYEAAVAALLKLPLDERGLAFAEAAAPEMERNADRETQRVTRGTQSWRRLLGRRGSYADALPRDDHAELRLGEESVYVSHPYDLTLDDMRCIVAACDEHRLDCSVDTRSWYFPGRTLRLLWRKAPT